MPLAGARGSAVLWHRRQAGLLYPAALPQPQPLPLDDMWCRQRQQVLRAGQVSLLGVAALSLSLRDHQMYKLQPPSHADGGQEQGVAPQHNLTSPAGAGMAVHMQVCFVLWHDISTAR